MLPAGVLAAIALIIAWRASSQAVSIPGSAGTFLFLAVIVAIFGGTIANLIHSRSPRPAGCLSNFPPFKPIRCGNAAFTKRTFLIADFAHPLYVQALIDANEPDALKVSLKSLDKASAAYDDKRVSG